MKRFIGFIVIVLIACLLWVLYALGAPNEDATEVVFHIKPGMAVSEIADSLEEKKLIRSSLVFRAYVVLRGRDDEIRAGRFLLNENQSLARIVDAITNPATGELSATFPEGFTIRHMDARLAELGLISPDEFATCARTCTIERPAYITAENLEGFLFPDTYFVSVEDFSSRELIERMLAESVTILEPLRSDITASGRTIQDVITMASIIEKEVRTENDYAIVAGILWKRLDNDWPLQADATLLYEKNKQKLTSEDLNEDSPYNTRRFRGFPPTPIANPGEKSIRAATYPVASDFWFYLTKPETGEVVYAKTNEEHNENIRRYLK